MRVSRLSELLWRQGKIDSSARKESYVLRKKRTRTSKIWPSESITAIARASDLQTQRLPRGAEKRHQSLEGDTKL